MTKLALCQIRTELDLEETMNAVQLMPLLRQNVYKVAE